MRILDLARNLIRLSGKPEDEVEIQFTGLREGEKLQEELFYSQEKILSTSCEKIKRTCGAFKDWSRLCRQLKDLAESMSVHGEVAIRAKIREIVPEYRSQLEESMHVGDSVRKFSNSQDARHSAVASSD